MSEWKENIIGNLANTFAGGTPSRSRVDYYKNGDIPWVSSSEVNQESISKTDELITELGLDNSSAKWIPKNSVLIALYGATAAQVSKLLIDATANQAVLALVPNEEIIDVDFLFYQVKQNKEGILFRAQGSGQINLSKSLIDNFSIKYPSLPTQQHIAKILSTTDAVIERTKAAIAKYKAIKQGMLQDLFTRGIDVTTKKLRPTYHAAPELYKESKFGFIPKEWEANQLSSVVEVINGGTPATHVKEYWNGEIPWLAVDDFNNGERFVSSANKKITHEGLKNSSTNILMPNMIVISARGTVGVISQLKIPMAFNQSCYGLNSINTNLQNDYLYYFLIYYKQFFGFTSYGSVFGTITRNYFDTMFIPMNLNSDEQRLIVDRLAIIDQKLQTEQNFLHKQQQIKAGLMGDLLSGRVKVCEI